MREREIKRERIRKSDRERNKIKFVRETEREKYKKREIIEIVVDRGERKVGREYMRDRIGKRERDR